MQKVLIMDDSPEIHRLLAVRLNLHGADCGEIHG